MEIKIPEAVVTVDIETTCNEKTGWEDEHVVVVYCGGYAVFQRVYSERAEAVFTDKHVHSEEDAKDRTLREFSEKFKKLLDSV